MKLPEKYQRVMVTGLFAGIFSSHVCVVKDATDEEILRACNREDPRAAGFSWTKVIRTKKDIQDLKLNVAKGFQGIPVPCVECPDRIHMVVR